MKVKNRFRIIVGVIIGIIIVIPINLMAKERNEKSIDKYIAIGDSISVEDSNKYNISYTSLIKEFLMAIDTNVSYENLSENGSTSKELLETINLNSNKIRNADLITISIGGNNILKPILKNLSDIIEENYEINTTYTEEELYKLLNEKLNNEKIDQEILQEVSCFENEFSEILKKIYELAPNSEVYICTIYNPINYECDLKYSLNKYIEIFNTIIYSKKSNYNYNIIDAYNLINSKKYCQFDLKTNNFDIHPNSAGHAIMASEVIREYEDYIYLNVKKVTDESRHILGQTIANANIIIMSDNKPIAISESDSKGKFRVEISPLKSGEDVHVLIYDKHIFSILYKFQRLVVKKSLF